MSVRPQFDQSDRLEMLERTVLELGSEVYALRSSITKTKTLQEQVMSVFNGLKQLLDDKGLITLEDFDAAVELGEALERFNANFEHSQEVENEKMKKAGH